MEHQKAVESTLEYVRKKGVQHAEVYFSDTKLLRISSQNERFNDLKISESHGMTLRIIHNDRCSRTYTEKITLNDIYNTVDEAIEYAHFAPINEKYIFTKNNQNNYDFNSIDPKLDKIDISKKKEQAILIEKVAKQQAIKNMQVTHAYYGDFHNKVLVGNTEGLITGYSEERCELLCGIRAQHGQEISISANTQTEREFNDLKVDNLVNSVIHRGIKLLGARQPQKGIYPTIFGPRAMAELLRVFSPVFFAESKEMSKLFGKISQKVASSVLTIIDDPTLPQAGMRYIDDEGNQCRRRTVVKNGVFQSYLLNNEAAYRLGLLEGGNSFRRSFKTRVITAASNMFIKNGNKAPEELLREIGSGIYIEELQGLEGTFHWEYPSFNIRGRGFVIEGGKISYPIHQFTITGTFQELLKNIEQIGNDFTWGLAMNRQCFGSPSILVKNIEIIA